MNAMESPALRLDKETHTYWRGANRAAGFSEICASMQVGIEDCKSCARRERHTHDSSFWTEDGRNQGEALHRWLLFLAQGNTWDLEVEPEIAGRVEAIKKFLRDSKFKFSGGETPLYDSIHRFCCIPDLWGHIGSFSYVIDAKRGAKMKIHALQTAAQKIALISNGFRAQKRAGLYLMDSGDYRIVPHEDINDERRWKNIVAAYHDKQEYRP